VVSAHLNRVPRSASPEQKLSALPQAALLAASGGLLDAVVYLDHGHVFANSMTGNVVFLGISAVSHDWHQVLPRLAPILAYIVGVTAARLLRVRPVRHLPLFALILEIAALLFVGFLPLTFPPHAFTAIVAFVAAFQVSTFRHVGSFTYNSTFLTGNLRDTVEGALNRLLERDPAARYMAFQKFKDLGLVCLAFLLGATLGAFVAPRFPTHALWFAEPFLLTVLLFTLRRPPQSAPVY
jgi:uncharacterized membrane protein YoaK (UPF0700 family)